MSGWGIKDDKTSTGTIAWYRSSITNLQTPGAVTGTGTAFTTEAAVGDILTANSIDFRITAIASNTACTVVDADTSNTPSLSAISDGENFTLSEKPSGMIKANSTSGVSSETIFGVDQAEVAAATADGKGIAQTGWVNVKTVASGRIAAVDTIGAADTDRAAGTYILDPSMYSTASNGVGARFQIVVAPSTGAATVTVLNPGTGFANNEVVTVADAQLGGGGAAALTFAVDGVTERKQYETLVALADGSASTMGDAEDTEFPDS
jgi:hypothetical protein